MTKEKKDVSVNFSVCKQFLIANGVRAAKDSVLEFQRRTNLYCAKMAKECAANTELRGAKTVFVVDVQKAFGE